MAKPQYKSRAARGRYPKRRRARPPITVFLAVASVAALTGLAAGVASVVAPGVIAPGYSETISGCRVTDGDTIRCGDERIRLLGIDAPELLGHCRAGRDCAPGDPYASTRSLSRGVNGMLKIARVGMDPYGRTLAAMAGPEGDLSCRQLQQEQADYILDWDDGLRLPEPARL